MRAGAPPRAGRLCGVAPSRPHPHRRRCLRDQPAGTETRTALVTRRVANAARGPGPQPPRGTGGRGCRGRGRRARLSVSTSPVPDGDLRRPQTPPAGPVGPEPASAPAPPRSGHSWPPPTSLAAPTPSLWLGRTCAHTWAAARSPLSSSHNGAPVPRLEGPWKACDPPLGLASQAPQVPAEARSPSLYSY